MVSWYFRKCGLFSHIDCCFAGIILGNADVSNGDGVGLVVKVHDGGVISREAVTFDGVCVGR